MEPKAIPNYTIPLVIQQQAYILLPFGWNDKNYYISEILCWDFFWNGKYAERPLKNSRRKKKPEIQNIRIIMKIFLMNEVMFDQMTKWFLIKNLLLAKNVHIKIWRRKWYIWPDFINLDLFFESKNFVWFKTIWKWLTRLFRSYVMVFLEFNGLIECELYCNNWLQIHSIPGHRPTIQLNSNKTIHQLQTFLAIVFNSDFLNVSRHLFNDDAYS